MKHEPFAEAERVAKVHRLISGGCELKRDNDYLRQIMFELEEDESPIAVYGLTLDASQEQRREYYHLKLLADEGLLEESGRSGGVFRITNKGHDFIEAIRSDDIWGKTKKAASAVSGVSISMLKEIAIGYVRQELVNRGIPFG